VNAISKLTTSLHAKLPSSLRCTDSILVCGVNLVTMRDEEDVDVFSDQLVVVNGSLGREHLLPQDHTVPDLLGSHTSAIELCRPASVCWEGERPTAGQVAVPVASSLYLLKLSSSEVSVAI